MTGRPMTDAERDAMAAHPTATAAGVLGTAAHALDQAADLIAAGRALAARLPLSLARDRLDRAAELLGSAPVEGPEQLADNAGRWYQLDRRHRRLTQIAGEA